MSSTRINARETALLLGRTPVQAGEPTPDTKQLQKELRAAVRTYERAALKLRKLRAEVRRAEREMKDARRQMKLWFQTIEATPLKAWFPPEEGGADERDAL